MAPEETAIAFTFNGITHAVMMATPADLEDFAVGFALTEGLIEKPADVASLEIIPTALGIEVRTWLPEDRARAYAARRRSMAGPTGCGLCGIESLEEAMRAAPPVPRGSAFERGDIVKAMASIESGQKLNAETHAVHAAAFWTPGGGSSRCARTSAATTRWTSSPAHYAAAGVSASDGLVLLTSRVSIELIQKAARIGRRGRRRGLRADRGRDSSRGRLRRHHHRRRAGRDFEIFTHPERIVDRVIANVA